MNIFSSEQRMFFWCDDVSIPVDDVDSVSFTIVRNFFGMLEARF